MDSVTAARLLGVPDGATRDDVRKAYRAKARDAHPDHGGSPDEFRRLTEARDCMHAAIDRRQNDRRQNTYTFMADWPADYWTPPTPPSTGAPETEAERAASNARAAKVMEDMLDQLRRQAANTATDFRTAADRGADAAAGGYRTTSWHRRNGKPQPPPGPTQAERVALANVYARMLSGVKCSHEKGGMVLQQLPHLLEPAELSIDIDAKGTATVFIHNARDNVRAILEVHQDGTAKVTTQPS